MNTDAQALHNSLADEKIHLGKGTTNSLGAGADHEGESVHEYVIHKDALEG